MDARFYCRDPLSTVARVMDLARRMGVGISALDLRDEGARFAVSLALTAPRSAAGSPPLDSFMARIGVLPDLEPENPNV